MAELNRPIYEALVTSEDAGMLRISLVDLPAVESNFLAFAKEDGEPVRLYFVRAFERRSEQEQIRVRGEFNRAVFDLSSAVHGVAYIEKESVLAAGYEIERAEIEVKVAQKRTLAGARQL